MVATTFVKRNSPVYSSPTLDANGKPVGGTLVKLGETIADWGRLQLVFNGTDVTFFRGVPSQIKGWEVNEPFGDAVATFSFPQITSFEALPAWLADYVNVELNLIRPDSTSKVLWEGLFTNEGNVLRETMDGIDVTCAGSLYQLDFWKKQPAFIETLQDLNDVFGGIISASRTQGLRTAALSGQATGIYTPKSGSWQPMLTGYFQDILSTAQLQTDLTDGELGVGLMSNSTNTGYYVVGDHGIVIPFGKCTPYYGSRRGLALNGGIVGSAMHPSNNGYWLVGSDGGVFSYGGVSFYGSLAGTTLSAPITDIEPTHTGLGYWLVGQDGGVFAFGDAGFFGSGVGSVVTPIVDMAAPPGAGGYWLLSHAGHVYSFGSGVTYYGSASTSGKNFVAIESSTTGLGYYLLADDGTVFAYGDAVHHGDMSGIPLTLPMMDMNVLPTGEYRLAGQDGGIFDFNGAAYVGSVPRGDGTPNQWTIMTEHPRTPVLRLKDQCTPHWTITTGTPGLIVDLQRDLALQVTSIYGEGTDATGCHWRNSRFPVTGSLDSAFFLPLHSDPAVEPVLYDALGHVTGANPAYDSSRMRIEHYENMGDQLAKSEGVLSAKGELLRDKTLSYFGRLTLAIDPEEGSRFEMRAGQNVKLKAHRGEDRILHIAHITVDWESLSVELEVDEKARDWITLSAIKSRDRDPVDPTRKKKPTYRNSKAIDDRYVVFDCEQNAGVFSTPAFAAGWYFIQVPLAQRGTIVKTIISANDAIEFAVGVWDRPTTSADATSIMPLGPFDVGLLTSDPWDDWGDDHGLIIAWGDQNQPAGYSPGQFDATTLPPPTGKLLDYGSWYYELPYPPWVWVGIYHEWTGSHSFTGQFFNGIEAN